MPYLEARGLVKSYAQAEAGSGLFKLKNRRRVVDGVDFQVELGEIVGLLGPNGAGRLPAFAWSAAWSNRMPVKSSSEERT